MRRETHDLLVSTLFMAEMLILEILLVLGLFKVHSILYILFVVCMTLFIVWISVNFVKEVFIDDIKCFLHRNDIK